MCACVRERDGMCAVVMLLSATTVCVFERETESERVRVSRCLVLTRCLVLSRCACACYDERDSRCHAALCHHGVCVFVHVRVCECERVCGCHDALCHHSAL